MVGQLKMWFVFLGLLSVFVGILADDAEDHQKILALESSVRKLDYRTKDLVNDMKTVKNTTGVLTTAIKKEGDLQEELAKKLNKVDDKSTEIEGKVDIMKGDWAKKVASLEKQLDDQKKAAAEDAKKLEEKMANLTHHMENKFAVEEVKLGNLINTVSKHEGTINKMQDKESDMNRKLNAIIALLPNSTHLNFTDDLSKRVDTLDRKVDMFHDDFQSQLNQLMTEVSDIKEKDIEEIKNKTVVAVKELKVQLGSFSEEIIVTKTKIAVVKNTTLGISGAVRVLKTEMGTFNKQLSQAKADLKKYIPDVHGFRYTGPGWSYMKDQAIKYYLNLDQCLKFCQMKRGLDSRYNGVNYIFHHNRPVCYCLKDAYGFNPDKDALSFLVA